MSEQWSWDQNPINLTCIATAIPNATITWWYRDREINREIIDRNYRVFGHGPRSDLIVTPLDLQYYGRYTCKAINPHGEAFYEIGLAFLLKKLIDFQAYYFPYLYVSAMPNNNVMLPGFGNFRCSTPFERLLAIKITNLCFKP